MISRDEYFIIIPIVQKSPSYSLIHWQVKDPLLFMIQEPPLWHISYPSGEHLSIKNKTAIVHAGPWQ